MSLPIDPVYCRKCKAMIAADAAVCPQCGWEQAKHYDPSAPAPVVAKPFTPPVYPPTNGMFNLGMWFLLLGLMTVAYNLVFANIGVATGQGDSVVNMAKMADRTVWTNAGCAYAIIGAIFITGSRRK